MPYEWKDVPLTTMERLRSLTPWKKTKRVQVWAPEPIKPRLVPSARYSDDLHIQQLLLQQQAANPQGSVSHLHSDANSSTFLVTLGSGHAAPSSCPAPAPSYDYSPPSSSSYDCSSSDSSSYSSGTDTGGSGGSFD